MTPSEERNWGMGAHLAAFAGYFVPMGNVLGPLIIWLVHKDKSDYITWHAKEALNFQITVVLAMFVAAVMILVWVGILLLPAIAVLDLIFVIMGGVAASKGEPYRYPVSIRFIS